MKILVVEDDERTNAILTEALTAHNYIVNTVVDGQTGLQLVQNFEYDLILLDIMLPGLDGISVCRQLRQERYQIPIMLLTAKDNSLDKVMGLNAGADDYMVKPFNVSELIARIRALLRRPKSATLTFVLSWGNLQFDTSKSLVTCDQKPLRLTVKEYQLLELFLRNPHRIFSKSAIVENLWSDAEHPAEDVVRTHIKGLRQKLKAGGVIADFLETVYGLGYRLKSPPGSEQSTDAISSSQSIETSKKQAQTEIVESLAKLWERFKDSFIDEVESILQAITALEAGILEPEVQQKAKHKAHKLAGALGSFGFHEGSSLAREIEQLLSVTNLDRLQTEQLSKLVNLLQQELQKPPVLPTSTAVCFAQHGLILVIDDDPALAERIRLEAAAWGFQVEVAPSLAAASEAMTNNLPDVILLDLTFAEPAESGLTFLAQLRNQHLEIPVIVLTGRNSLADRLEAACLGSHAFIHKSVCSSEILRAVTQVLNHAQTAQAKVMIVDDDPKLLESLSALLEPWGLHLTTLADPQQFWQVLEASVPDLLILDVKMPDINGVELCQVVRNDPQWSQLPVLFLSACHDAQTMHQVFIAGADDYIQKPIVGPELIARIFNRLERTKIHRDLAQIDPLTSLTNRQKSIQQLTSLLYLAERHHQPFCFMLLSLDNFKLVNNQYGYDSGDMVLSQFGKLLKQSFQSGDVISRWGGKEFVIGLYGVKREQGLKLLLRFKKIWNQQEFTDTNNQIFRASCSAGIAQYPNDGADLKELYRAADATLFQGKILE
ncbi:MAG: response regulator [Brasilonema angustatum HA4187-MV1]|jgi:diguanylate cyclase (GGDEF)-like protein|nr:response regulator [Brasilonema angustatum HA4187-MV1]